MSAGRQRLTEGELTAAVRSSVDAMPWLGKSDDAMVALAVRYAQRLDGAAELYDEVQELAEHVPQGESLSSEQLRERFAQLEAAVDLTRAYGHLGPHLGNVLRSLGGAPLERGELAKGAPKTSGKLATVRKLRDAQTGTGGAPPPAPAGDDEA